MKIFFFFFVINVMIIDDEVQKNWNLFSVNIVMAGTGIYQLSRKIR